MDVAHAVASRVSRADRISDERQARRASHPANVFGGIALVGCTARDAVVLGVVPVDDAETGFHRNLPHTGRGHVGVRDQTT